MRGLTPLWRTISSYASHRDPLTQAANWIALVVAWNQPFYPLYLYAIVGERMAPSLLTFLSTPFFAAIPAVSKRHALAARAMLPAVGIANVIISAKALGDQSGVEIFLIPCATIAALLFRPRERVVGLCLIGLSLLTYLLLHGNYGAPLAAYDATEYQSMVALNALSAATLTVFVGLAISSAYARLEEPHR
jgi:hypothetical protein